jgi:sugar-phosphatase
MTEALKAVIFDMDGVLIDSEHLWRRAMIEGFAEYGITVTENECRKTMGMRIGEVVQWWLRHLHKPAETAPHLEKRIVQLLMTLIGSEGRPIAGIPELIDFCKSRGLLVGLATSSSTELMQAVLTRLKISELIHASVSAEHMQYAKPHPEVFISCARQLGVAPAQCIVVEDSLNGVIAARAAGMQVIAVPDGEHLQSNPDQARQFVLAHYHKTNMQEVLALFKTLFI